MTDHGPHCETCTCGCTCGYGGQHEPTNLRCALNQGDQMGNYISKEPRCPNFGGPCFCTGICHD